MNDLNRVILTGRLTRDPEIRYLPTGLPILLLRLASSQRYKSQEEWKERKLFIDCASIGSQAERLGQRLRKGERVLVEGEVRLREWNESGQKRQQYEIFAEIIKSLEIPSSPERQEV